MNCGEEDNTSFVIIYLRKKIAFEDNVILFLYPYRFRQASGLHKYRNIILYRVI